MRALVLAVAIALSPLAAVAQETANRGDENGELWGERDSGEDKGRVQASGSSYNLTHIAYAAVIVALMGGFLIWLIRRHSEPS